MDLWINFFPLQEGTAVALLLTKESRIRSQRWVVSDERSLEKEKSLGGEILLRPHAES